jgi:two-component system OmpR family sensor kinase
MSLRLRLLITLVPLFIVALGIANVATYFALDSFLSSRVDEQAIQAQSSLKQFFLASFENQGAGVALNVRGNATPFPQGTYGELRGATGAVLLKQTFSFSSDTSSRPILPAKLSPGTSTSPALYTVSGSGAISSYRVDVGEANDGTGNIIVVAIPLSDLNATLAQLLLLELGVSLGVTLLLAFTTLFVVRRSLRPLEQMGVTAKSIVIQDLNQRVSPATEHTEVGRLGLALNAMLSKLENAFAEKNASQERLQQFVADVSHELRTPLTSMRGYAEILREKSALTEEEITLATRRIEEEAKRLGILVDDLLLLARMDQGRELEYTRVDLEKLVDDASADARIADPSRKITTKILAPLIIDGDELRLRQVIGNLIRNALVHTPTGTPVETVLRADENFAILEVIDHGTGILEADSRLIFERFHRSDPDQSRDQGSSGLGLSIAAAVVQRHKGTISVSQTVGGGATFQIHLPLSTE